MGRCPGRERDEAPGGVVIDRIDLFDHGIMPCLLLVSLLERVQLFTDPQHQHPLDQVPWCRATEYHRAMDVVHGAVLEWCILIVVDIKVVGVVRWWRH
jgi:hypothetical protein